jgi:sugar O-acyltransferase (sialic acid O-acetyltransferase NeuD family)
MAIVLFGAGGTAKNIEEILGLQGLDWLGYVSTEPAGTLVRGKPVLCSPDAFVDRWHEWDVDTGIITIGFNVIRRELYNRCRSLPLNWPVMIHPSVVMSSTAHMGEGSIVMAGGVIQSDTHIGQGCLINTNASIDHDCHIGDHASVAPGAILSGAVTLGACSAVGAGAVILEKRTVGRHCVVGAGAVVTQDIPDYAVAWGVPARVQRFRTEREPYLRS